MHHANPVDIMQPPTFSCICQHDCADRAGSSTSPTAPSCAPARHVHNAHAWTCPTRSALGTCQPTAPCSMAFHAHAPPVTPWLHTHAPSTPLTCVTVPRNPPVDLSCPNHPMPTIPHPTHPTTQPAAPSQRSLSPNTHLFKHQGYPSAALVLASPRTSGRVRPPAGTQLTAPKPSTTSALLHCPPPPLHGSTHL